MLEQVSTDEKHWHARKERAEERLNGDLFSVSLGKR